MCLLLMPQNLLYILLQTLTSAKELQEYRSGKSDGNVGFEIKLVLTLTDIVFGLFGRRQCNSKVRWYVIQVLQDNT